MIVYSVESYASFSAVREQYKQVLRIKEGRDPHNIPMALIGAKVNSTPLHNNNNLCLI